MDIAERILNSVERLPTLPTIYYAITEAMEDPRTSTEKLAGIIASDQVSAIKVLKVANSPFFGFRGKISTISEAVFYLGFNEIRNIIFSLTVIKYFSATSKVNNFPLPDFWVHSIATGIASRVIGSASREQGIENYFLAGILHDIGKLVLVQFAVDDFNKALELATANKISLRAAEQEVMRTDHTVIGNLLAGKWKLPAIFQDAILGHHAPDAQDRNKKLVSAVHLGNLMVKLLEYGRAGDDFVQKPQPGIWAELKLPEGFFTKVFDQLDNDIRYTTKVILRD